MTYYPEIKMYVDLFDSGTEFFREIICSEMTTVLHVATLQVYVEAGVRYLPAFAVLSPLSERLQQCVAFHDGGESAAACVH